MQVNPWLRNGSFVFFAVVLLSDYYVAQALDVWILIGGVVAILCGLQCAKWASKIKKSPNVAYLTGFVFNLVGLAGYWVYRKLR